MTGRRSPLLERPVLREQFRKELRGRLMSEAVVALAPRPSRFSFPALLRPALAAAAILVLVAAGATSAAASSLPGDALYAVKRAGEDVRLALTFDDVARTQLLSEFTDRRLEELAEIAPKARILENRLYVVDGERYSSAGITAGIDLMLHLVHQCTDQSCALAVARYLLVYLRRSGSDPQLSPWLEGRNHIHPAVHRAQDAIAADLTKSWSLAALARVAGASDRHLSRLFHEHVGMSIPEYSNRLRVAFEVRFQSF